MLGGRRNGLMEVEADNYRGSNYVLVIIGNWIYK